MPSFFQCFSRTSSKIAPSVNYAALRVQTGDSHPSPLAEIKVQIALEEEKPELVVEDKSEAKQAWSEEPVLPRHKKENRKTRSQFFRFEETIQTQINKMIEARTKAMADAFMLGLDKVQAVFDVTRADFYAVVNLNRPHAKLVLIAIRDDKKKCDVKRGMSYRILKEMEIIGPRDHLSKSVDDLIRKV